MSPLRHRLFPLVLVAIGVASAASPLHGQDRSIDFNRDVRPILSNHCYACHGPDVGQRQAGLRLDVRESATGELVSGNVAIAPGDADASILLERVAADDPHMRMPPPDSGEEPLSREQIEILRRWVEEGAEYERHWAFIPPVRPDVPRFTQPEGWDDAAPIRNPIDAFVLTGLLSEGLSPSPEADKISLLRRVTLDLTGLPPTPEEVDAFLADESPEAYEKIVDRLLASPRYGEHMARYWLDAVRYGDTHGLHLDNYREIWPYRDWVINAFNRNQPFDEFTIDQIAGDLRENPTDEQLIATGYVRSNVTTNEGGSIVEEVLVRNTVDRIETTATVWLALTAGCAACHDHKFDPLTQKEFYQLYAFFNSTAEPAMDENAALYGPVLRLPTPEQKEQLAEIENRIADLEEQQRETAAGLDDEIRRWADEWHERLKRDSIDLEPSRLAPWHYIGPFTTDDTARLFEHAFPPEEEIKLDAENEQKDGTLGWQERPEWNDGEPQFLSGDYTAHYLYRTIHADSPRRTKLSLGSDDGIKLWVNGTPVHSKFEIRGVAPDQDFVEIELVEGENKLLMKIVNQNGGCGFYFRVADERPGGLADEVLPILTKASDVRSDDDRQKLREYYLREVSTEYRGLQKQIDELQAEHKKITDSAPGTLIARELDQPRDAFVLKRGEYDLPEDKVERAVPTWLHPLPEGAPLDRMGLALWLVSEENPLTARVFVNRLWQRVFGSGLVDTSEDFGIQSRWPSHPELLDWLAVEFRESGWDIKHMMKLLVMSSTYRQEAAASSERIKRDPENRLLARGPRFRMDGEMIRDQALFVSGLLVEKLGGPSVKPYQPEGLWEAVGYTSSNTAKFKQDHGEALYRRSLYTFWKRTAPPPTMAIMDAPSREACTVRRPRTNTPLAALALMNDIQFVEAARHLAQRMLSEAGMNSDGRLEYLFRLVLARRPNARELDLLRQQLETHLERFADDNEAAEQLLAVGESPRDESLDPAHHAAWIMVANLVLNLDEALNK